MACVPADINNDGSFDQFALSKDQKRADGTVQSASHKIQAVSRLDDMVASARAFSDLSNPEVIRNVCCTKIPGWVDNKIRPCDVNVDQIMAGLTNQLFTVSLSSEVKSTVLPRKALFRVYGKTVGDLYDSAFELSVFKVLSKYDSAPRLLAEFRGGRIEEYILGPTLLMKDMGNPAVLCAVATILAKFHRLHETVPEIAGWRQDEACLWRCLKRWTAKSESIFSLAKQSLKDNYQNVDHECTRLSSCESVVSTEDLMMDRAKQMTDEAKRGVLASLEDTYIEEMFVESASLKDLILPKADDPEARNPILSIAFCHNDVQENNILVTGPRLRLIDFEYADYNYPAFDIANFFCEMTIDYCVEESPYYSHKWEPEEFPSPEIIRLFGSVYLSQALNEPILPSNRAALDGFVNVVYRFVLASHLLWGFWSIIRAPQAETSSDFDFLLYAKSRFTAYKKWKKFLISKGLLPEAN